MIPDKQPKSAKISFGVGVTVIGRENNPRQELIDNVLMPFIESKK